MFLQKTLNRSMRNSLSTMFFFRSFSLMSWSTQFKKWSISRDGVLLWQTSLTFWRWGKIVAIRSIFSLFWGMQHCWEMVLSICQICLNRCSLSLVLIEYSIQNKRGSINWNTPGYRTEAEGSLISLFWLSLSTLIWWADIWSWLSRRLVRL